jgi:hypothetical protein
MFEIVGGRFGLCLCPVLCFCVLGHMVARLSPAAPRAQWVADAVATLLIEPGRRQLCGLEVDAGRLIASRGRGMPSYPENQPELAFRCRMRIDPKQYSMRSSRADSNVSVDRSERKVFQSTCNADEGIAK